MVKVYLDMYKRKKDGTYFKQIWYNQIVFFKPYKNKFIFNLIEDEEELDSGTIDSDNLLKLLSNVVYWTEEEKYLLS